MYKAWGSGGQAGREGCSSHNSLFLYTREELFNGDAEPQGSPLALLLLMVIMRIARLPSQWCKTLGWASSVL